MAAYPLSCLSSGPNTEPVSIGCYVALGECKEQARPFVSRRVVRLTSAHIHPSLFTSPGTEILVLNSLGGEVPESWNDQNIKHACGRVQYCQPATIRKDSARLHHSSSQIRCAEDKFDGRYLSLRYVVQHPQLPIDLDVHAFSFLRLFVSYLRCAVFATSFTTRNIMVSSTLLVTILGTIASIAFAAPAPATTSYAAPSNKTTNDVKLKQSVVHQATNFSFADPGLLHTTSDNTWWAYSTSSSHGLVPMVKSTDFKTWSKPKNVLTSVGPWATG